ncbi:MAG: metal-dependent transcriptional regulator [Candidatus Thermoplasmatota archaeon]
MRKKTIEDYVELINNLQIEKNRVHTNEIAQYFNITPSSVTEAFKKLSEEGYIDYKSYRGVKLTKKGKKLADKTKKAHNNLKKFLMLLGIRKEIAEKDACEMEHILHEETMNALIKFVELINKCEVIPYWLSRLKKYIRNGRLNKCNCPKEIAKICRKYEEPESEKIKD